MSNRPPNPPDVSFGQSDFYGAVIDVPDLGIWHLTIKDAAALIALDKWFAGEVEAELPETDRFDPKDPMIRGALSDSCNAWETKMVEAIEHGSLRSDKVRRDADETMDTQQTFVNHGELVNWLRERGYETGDAFEDYSKDEMKIHSDAIDDLYLIRALRRVRNRRVTPAFGSRCDPRQVDLDELAPPVRDLVDTIDHLRREIDQLNAELGNWREKERQQLKRTANADRELTTRGRRTLLTIIAALCKESEIDYQARGAAQRIKELTERIDARVSDNTIRDVLSEIPDALETRQHEGPS